MSYEIRRDEPQAKPGGRGVAVCWRNSQEVRVARKEETLRNNRAEPVPSPFDVV